MSDNVVKVLLAIIASAEVWKLINKIVDRFFKKSDDKGSQMKELNEMISGFKDAVTEMRVSMEKGFAERDAMGQKRFDTHAETIERINAQIGEIYSRMEDQQEFNAEQSKFNKNMGSFVQGWGHDRIIFLGQKYCERGYITPDEYENLLYIYKPYKDFGGNGTAEKMMGEVKKLPMSKGGKENEN